MNPSQRENSGNSICQSDERLRSMNTALQSLENVVQCMDILESTPIEDDEDIQPFLRKQIDTLWLIFKTLNDDEIIQLYSQFESSQVPTRELLQTLVQSIRATIGDKIEFAKTIFLPFNLLYREEVNGKEQRKSILEVALVRRGGFWRSHQLEYPLLREGVQGPIFGKRKINTFLVSQSSDVTYGVQQKVGEIQERVPENPPNSYAKSGRVRRREKYRREQQLRASQQERGTPELYERYRNLQLYIDKRLAEFAEFIVSHIPYISEIKQSFHLKSDLEGLLKKWEHLLQVQPQHTVAEEKTKNIELEIERLQAEIVHLESDLQYRDGLLQSEVKHQKPLNFRIKNIESEMRKIKKNIRAAKIRINQCKRNLLDQQKKEGIKHKKVNVAVDASKLEEEIKNITNKLASCKIKFPITSDEFVAGLCWSLGINYTIPDTPSQFVIHEDWVDKNTLPIFVGLVGEHFRWDDLTLVDILRLQESLSTLGEDQENPDVPLDELDGISQNRIHSFLSTLEQIIPQVYLIEAPHFSRTEPVSQKIETLKIDTKTPHQKQPTLGKEERRNELQNEIILKNKKLETYKQYWEEFEEKIKKKLFSLNQVIIERNTGITRKAYSNFSVEQLRQELAQTQHSLDEVLLKEENAELIDNSNEYLELKREIAQLAGKVRHIR